MSLPVLPPPTCELLPPLLPAPPPPKKPLEQTLLSLLSPLTSIVRDQRHWGRAHPTSPATTHIHTYTHTHTRKVTLTKDVREEQKHQGLEYQRVIWVQ